MIVKFNTVVHGATPADFCEAEDLNLLVQSPWISDNPKKGSVHLVNPGFYEGILISGQDSGWHKSLVFKKCFAFCYI